MLIVGSNPGQRMKPELKKKRQLELLLSLLLEPEQNDKDAHGE